jgi:hypothetical protein
VKINQLLLLLAVQISLTACGQQVPKEKAAYVGEWKGDSMYLLITEDGQVKYQRSEGSGSKSIDAPLQEFAGDNFDVGVGPLSTTFVVGKPPHREGDDWKMTVDGVELTKTTE